MVDRSRCLHVKVYFLQLNSYTVSQVTLDYATRILRMLRHCNYIRMEVQNYTSMFYTLNLQDAPAVLVVSIIVHFLDVDDVLNEGILDSLYVRQDLPTFTYFR